MKFHKMAESREWMNFEAIAETTTQTVNAVIEYGRKFDGVKEWKSGNFYHLKGEFEKEGENWSTKEKFTYTQKCELFAVTYFNGAISVIMLTETCYRDVKFPVHEITFYEGVREAFNEDYEGEVEDRQLELLERLMSDGYRAVYGFDHDGKTEYADMNRFYGCNVFPNKDTGTVDAVDIKEYHVGGSNLETRNISKYSRMLEDIVLIPVYIDYEENEK